MAPPRRATSRRVGSQEPRQQAAPVAPAQAPPGASEDPDDSSSSSRPLVRTRQSFAYGTTKTPPMPLPLEENPEMTTEQMAETIDAGMRQANEREREPSNLREQAHSGREGQIRTRSQARRPESNNSSPAPPVTRRRRRQMTPDDQLMDNIREGSRSPGHRENSVSDSVISWRVERDIHGNQTTNGFETEETRGMATFAAQPRRPAKASGLREMIKEEPEETEEFDISSVPASEEISTNITEARANQKITRRSPIEAFPAHVSSTVEPTAPAPATVRDSTSGTSDTSPTIPIAPTLIRKFTLNPLTILTILIAMLATFGTYTFSDKLMQIPEALRSSPIFSGINQSRAGYNVSDFSGHAAAINHLSSQFDKLGERFRDMSRDINDLKDDWNKKLPLINEVISRAPPSSPPQAPRNPLIPPRVNFCSVGLGAVIDPYLTTPSKTREHSLIQRIHLYAAGIRQGPAPASALQPWDGAGDCWCSSSRTKVTQLAVLLGRNIVPEEVVIEHIPKGATLDPGAAPRDMELWAEFKSDPKTDETSKPTHSLHRTIMDTLREAFPDEPESAYSDDMILGSNFYRVGKWEYDIDADNHIQAFELNAVIDTPNSRVEKVVFRANTNWGGDHTCFYRVRLHGYL